MREIEKYYYDPFNMDSHEVSKVTSLLYILKELNESAVALEKETRSDASQNRPARQEKRSYESSGC